MASLITHLYITQHLKDKYNLEDDTLLGSILPDLIKLAKLQNKNESHYIEKDKNLPNIDKYINQNMKHGYNSIQLGYLFHLIQDYIWYQYLFELENKSNSKDLDFANKIYSDMNICDKYLLEKSNINKYQFNYLKEMLEKMSNNQEIISCINTSLKIRKIENNQIYFITKDSLNDYIQKAFSECSIIFKKLKHI